MNDTSWRDCILDELVGQQFLDRQLFYVLVKLVGNLLNTQNGRLFELVVVILLQALLQDQDRKLKQRLVSSIETL